MPDFDFDAFNHDTPYEGEDGQQHPVQPVASAAPPFEIDKEPEVIEEKITDPDPVSLVNNTPPDNGSTEEVDKW